uniref:F-BAR domain-containing protein n=1 Tax=Plectus sambesii TaxID=2011161 RepID=A0A914XTR0_9BILA
MAVAKWYASIDELDLPDSDASDNDVVDNERPFQSHDDLSSVFMLSNSTTDRRPVVRRHSTFQGKSSNNDYLTSDQMDKLLHMRDDGVELAFERTKAWSKYCKEILSYVQRRLAIENEHARAVQKLCDQTRAAISE